MAIESAIGTAFSTARGYRVGKRAREALEMFKKQLETYADFEERNIEFTKAFLRYLKRDVGVDIDTFTILRRNASSNYSVSAGVDGGKLVITYLNPERPEERAKRSRNEVLRIRTIDTSKINDETTLAKEIKKVVEDIAELSAKKAVNDYFASLHNHTGFYTEIVEKDGIAMFGETYRLIDLEEGKVKDGRGKFNNGPLDDGMHHYVDALLHAALYNIDIMSFSSHNHFFDKMYEQMKRIGEELGIIVVAGTEATMPVYDYGIEDVAPLLERMNKALHKHYKKFGISKENRIYFTCPQKDRFDEEDLKALYDKYKRITGKEWKDKIVRHMNGPHILIHFENEEIGREIQTMMDNRDFKYAPFSSKGMELFEKLAEIRKKYGKKVLIHMAHPFCSMQLPAVGIADRMRIGETSLKRVLEFLKKGIVNGIANYNATLEEGKNSFKPLASCSTADKHDKAAMDRLAAWRKKQVENAAEFKAYAKEAVAEYFGEKAEKYGFVVTNNTLNLAVAEKLVKDASPAKGGKYTLAKIGESDTHWYDVFSITNPTINNLARAFTVITSEREIKTVEDVFKAWHDYNEGKEYVNIESWHYTITDSKGRTVLQKSVRPTKEEKRMYKELFLESYGIHGGLRVLLPDVIWRGIIKMREPIKAAKCVIQKFMKG